MSVELARLALGLLLVLFHRQIGEFMLAQERPLVIMFRQRGVPLPMLTEKTTGNIYFALGVFVSLLECARLWMMLPP